MSKNATVPGSPGSLPLPPFAEEMEKPENDGAAPKRTATRPPPPPPAVVLPASAPSAENDPLPVRTPVLHQDRSSGTAAEPLGHAGDASALITPSSCSASATSSTIAPPPAFDVAKTWHPGLLPPPLPSPTGSTGEP